MVEKGGLQCLESCSRRSCVECPDFPLVQSVHMVDYARYREILLSAAENQELLPALKAIHDRWLAADVLTREIKRGYGVKAPGEEDLRGPIGSDDSTLYFRRMFEAESWANVLGISNFKIVPGEL